MNSEQKQMLVKIYKALNYVGKMISSAVLVILVLVGMFLIYYLITAKIVAVKEGVEPKISLYTIASPSMVPNIKVYDLVVNVRVDDPSTIKVGDVITFKSTSSLTTDWTITHRVVEVKIVDGNYEYVTKGDANPTIDSDTAKYANVIGKVVLKIPKIGWIQFTLASKLGWLIMILLPALGVIIYDVLKIFKIVDTKQTAKSLKSNITLDLNDLKNKKEEKQVQTVLRKAENTDYFNQLEELKKFNSSSEDHKK